MIIMGAHPQEKMSDLVIFASRRLITSIASVQFLAAHAQCTRGLLGTHTSPHAVALPVHEPVPPYPLMSPREAHNRHDNQP